MSMSSAKLPLVLFLAPLVDFSATTGEITHIRELIGRLSDRGYRFILVGKNAQRFAEGFERELVEGVDIASLKVPLLGMLTALMDCRRKVAKLVRDYDVDLIHERYSLTNPGLAVAETAGIPAVAEVNGVIHLEMETRGYPRWIVDMAGHLSTRRLAEASQVAIVSEAMRDILIDRGIPPRSLRCIPNGVALDSFPFPDRNFDQPLSVGYVGSFTPWHNLRTVVEAARIVKSRDLPIEFTLVGTGSTAAETKKRVEEYGLTDKVHIPGPVPFDKVPNWLESFDIGLILKETNIPGSPIKLFEYLAAGLPVIASDSPDLKFIEQEGVGWCCSPHDAEELAGILRQRVGGRSQLRAMSRRARGLAESDYSWDSVAERMDTLVYQPLLDLEEPDTPEP